MIDDGNIVCGFIDNTTQELLKIESVNKDIDVIQWLTKNKNFIEEKLLIHGGIILRNFKIDSVSEFNKAVQVISPNLLDYVYRSTPRTK